MFADLLRTLELLNEMNGRMEKIKKDIEVIAAQRDALLAACKKQHNAIDILFARLIQKDPNFLPTKSGLPWEAIIEGNAAIADVEGAPQATTSSQ